MVRDTAKIGIILMTYNQGRFVEYAIDSLKRQTLQDFDVYLIDDGSDDDITYQIVKKLSYEKIKRKFLYKTNKGTALRQLEMYQKIKNEYVLIFCADDVLGPHFLEKTVDFLDSHLNYGAVSVNIRFFINTPEDYYASHEYDEKLMTLSNLLVRNFVLGSSLMRKKALDETDLSGGFIRYQDWDRWISMLEAGWRIGLVPEHLFYYRQLPDSLSHSAKIEDEIIIRKKILKKHKESYRNYYEQVILNMEYRFLEMKEAKDWLDGQYHSLNKEIERLNREIEKFEEKEMNPRSTKKDNRGIIKRITDKWR